MLYPGCEREVFSCGECGASYFWPVPSPEDIARCYPPVYFRDFLKQYWKDYYKGRLLAEGLSAWKSRGVFVDVGCALGTMLAGVRDHSGWKVLGLEFARAAAETGKRLNGVEIAQGGLSDAPWPDESVDCVHMNNVLEHEAKPAEALAAASRLLKPGGRLRLSLPNGPLDILPTKTLYRRWGRAVTTRHGGHLFFFSRKALFLLLERAGLRPLSVRNFHLKTALKARGWTPRAYRLFKRAPRPRTAAPQGDEKSLSAEECRRLIPPRPSWRLYGLRARLRRLWRWPFDWGCDFEVLAEKSGRRP
ncbi:MAG: class I SAM-dependent methyltransferase [Elusimicrobiota bacterium]